MNCTKTTQISHGAIVFQKCSCPACKIKKQASKEFWERFDKAYKEWKK